MELSNELRDKANAAVSTAVMQLMRKPNLAFDTSVLLNLQREFTLNEEITMKVEGTKLIINPNWFCSLSKTDQQWNFRHTAWHIIGFDEVRVGDREEKEWNTACDLWINNMLTDDKGFDIPRPADAAYDPMFRNWEKEDIYQYLLQNQDKQEEMDQDSMAGDCGGGQQPESDGDGEGQDNGNGDDNQDGNQPSQGQSREQLEQDIQNMIAQAAIQAKQAGNQVPSSVEQYLDELYNPKLPWNKLLMKYMTSYNTYDYSYTRIHKKFFPHGIIMPSMYSEGLGPVITANDQSGSVSDKEYEIYLGAIKAIHDDFNPEYIRCLGFTTDVNNDTTIAQDDDFNKLKFRASGGTDIPCVFDYIKANNIKPEVLIIFSDMESRIPTEKPPYDVIWISVGNPHFKAPFGRTIHVEI